MREMHMHGIIHNYTLGLYIWIYSLPITLAFKEVYINFITVLRILMGSNLGMHVCTEIQKDTYTYHLDIGISFLDILWIWIHCVMNKWIKWDALHTTWMIINYTCVFLRVKRRSCMDQTMNYNLSSTTHSWIIALGIKNRSIRPVLI